MNRFLAERPRRLWPALALHGWAGVLLIALAWPLNWGLPGLRTHLLFFPLWLGYALLVDALVLRRRDTSILTRSPKGFALLFAYSAPAWWLFEAFNLRTQNWEYLGGDRFGTLTYFLLTLSPSPPSCLPCSKRRSSCALWDGCAAYPEDRA